MLYERKKQYVMTKGRKMIMRVWGRRNNKHKEQKEGKEREKIKFKRKLEKKKAKRSKKS